MCLTPITLHKDSIDEMRVSCGNCEACHQLYVNQWSFRIQQHLYDNPIFYCITLTYDNKNLPIVRSSKTNKVYMTLVRSHISSFMKRIRSRHDKRFKDKYKPKISYMAVGEYGDSFKRPHYHCIIFNADVTDIICSWQKGSVYFGRSNLSETVNYCLKYALKSKFYKRTHRVTQRPFANFSKHIGIGYLKRVTRLTPTVNYKGYNISTPRYYRKKLNVSFDYSEFEQKCIERQQAYVQYVLHDTKMSLNAMKKLKYDKLVTKSKHAYDNEVDVSGIDLSLFNIEDVKIHNVPLKENVKTKLKFDKGLVKS